MRIPIFISLDQMLEGSRFNNLAKVIMEVVMIGGGLPQDQIAKKFICFGVDGANVFQGTKTNVTRQIHDNGALHWIGVHCMPRHTNSNVNLVGFAFGDVAWKFVTKLAFIFCTFT